MKFERLRIVAICMGIALSQNGWAQNQQIFDSYYDKCFFSKNQADWKSVATFCDAAEKEAFKFGSYSNQVGDISDVIGSTLKILGRHKDAEVYLLQALSIRERNAGRTSNGPELVASTQNNLANLYFGTGRLNDAEALYKKSLVIYEKVYGKESKQVATVLANMGAVLKEQEKLDEAEGLYLKAANIQQQKEPDSLALSNSYENIGNLYKDKGILEKAIAYQIKCLQIREKILPENHPLIGTSLNNMGDLMLQMEGYSEAASTLEDSLKIRKASLPNDHPEIGQSLVNLGRAYYGLGRYKDAEQCLREGLKRREISFGKTSGPVAYTLDQLAKVLRATKREKDAIALEKRAANIRNGKV